MAKKNPKRVEPVQETAEVAEQKYDPHFGPNSVEVAETQETPEVVPVVVESMPITESEYGSQPATPKLTPAELQTARRVAADAFEACGGDLKTFRNVVMNDPRLDESSEIVFDSTLVAACECFRYWQANGIDKPTAHIPE